MHTRLIAHFDLHIEMREVPGDPLNHRILGLIGQVGIVEVEDVVVAHALLYGLA